MKRIAIAATITIALWFALIYALLDLLCNDQHWPDWE